MDFYKRFDSIVALSEEAPIIDQYEPNSVPGRLREGIFPPQVLLELIGTHEKTGGALADA